MVETMQAALDNLRAGGGRGSVGAGVLFCLLLALLASFRRRRMGIC